MYFCLTLTQLTSDYAGWTDKLEGESFMDPGDGFIKVLNSREEARSDIDHPS